jgi:KipI family sensor histidine kinase inhibitor
MILFAGNDVTDMKNHLNTLDDEYPRLHPCGDSALTIEFGDDIDVAVNESVMALDAVLGTVGSPILETVPTYRSLLVVYDSNIGDYETVATLVLSFCNVEAAVFPNSRVWRVPVAYGGSYGLDLTELAERHDMTSGEVVRRHSEALYLVYMIGFMPGFAYLGGLDAALATPRRPTPRLAIPEGSITIGGVQTAITSVESPSGWHLVGRSAVRAFMPEREPACLFAAGDFVTFEAVSPEEMPALMRAADRGEPVAKTVE